MQSREVRFAGGPDSALAEPLLTSVRSDPEAGANEQAPEDEQPERPSLTTGSTLQSTVATLCIGVLGSGQLALPYAVHLLGLAGGALALAVMGVFAVFTLYMLAECRALAQSQCYGSVLNHMLGPRCSHIANGLLALYAWGGGVTYLMILGKELEGIVSSLTAAVPDSIGPNVFMWVAVALCILPLSFFRSLDRLKFTSTLGAMAAVYITLVVTMHAFSGVIHGGPISPCHSAHQNCSSTDCESESADGFLNGQAQSASHPLQLWPALIASPTTPEATAESGFRLWPQTEGLPPFHILFNVITAFAIFGFALNSAWCFVPVINNLQDKTTARTSAVIVSSQTIILINYAFISVSGYFSFCDKTNDDILQNLDNSAAVVLARAMLVTQLSCALPLRFSVTRSIISKYALWGHEARSSGIPDMSIASHLITTALIVCSAALTANFSGSISLAMSLASTICASAISYIFPSLCYLALLSNKEKNLQSSGMRTVRYAATCAILIYGLFMMFVGTGMNVYGAIKGFVVIGG